MTKPIANTLFNLTGARALWRFQNAYTQRSLLTARSKPTSTNPPCAGFLLPGHSQYPDHLLHHDRDQPSCGAAWSGWSCWSGFFWQNCCIKFSHQKSPVIDTSSQFHDEIKSVAVIFTMTTLTTLTRVDIPRVSVSIVSFFTMTRWWLTMTSTLGRIDTDWMNNRTSLADK